MISLFFIGLAVSISVFTAGSIFFILSHHNLLVLKNLIVTLSGVTLSFLAGYRYYLFFKAHTDLGMLSFDQFALVMFFTQTAWWLIWFRKEESGLILSLVATSALTLFLAGIVSAYGGLF